MKTIVSILFTVLILLLSSGANAQDNPWLGLSLDLTDARYTPNKTVYETDGVYMNNWVKIELLTPEARKEEGCSSKNWLVQYRSDFHEFRIVALQCFDENGKLIASDEYRYAEWHHVVPESVVDWLSKAAKELWRMTSK